MYNFDQVFSNYLIYLVAGGLLYVLLFIIIPYILFVYLVQTVKNIEFLLSNIENRLIGESTDSSKNVFHKS